MQNGSDHHTPDAIAPMIKSTGGASIELKLSLWMVTSENSTSLVFTVDAYCLANFR